MTERILRLPSRETLGEGLGEKYLTGKQILIELNVCLNVFVFYARMCYI